MRSNNTLLVDSDAVAFVFSHGIFNTTLAVGVNFASGIGLSLSRQIMRMHNGSLVLTRSDSRGTVFTLVFR